MRVMGRPLALSSPQGDRRAACGTESGNVRMGDRDSVVVQRTVW